MGFKDIRGTLFLISLALLNTISLKFFFRERKNLTKHYNGNTLKIILNTIDELGYNVFGKFLMRVITVFRRQEKEFT